MIRPVVTLDGVRVLILEDDYFLATDLQRALERSGATVLGPFADVAAARQALESDRPDCAFVDINLGHGPSFDLPTDLQRGGIPFAFITGYDADTIPPAFSAVERLEKPIEPHGIAGIASRLLGRNEDQWR